MRLDALPVDNTRAVLVILLLGDPNLLEGRKRGKDGSANPDRVLALRRGDDLDLHRGRGEGLDFFLHTGSDAREHSGTAQHDNVVVQVLPDVDVGRDESQSIATGINCNCLLTISYFSDIS